MIGRRVCKRCEIDKPVEDYYRNKPSKGGRLLICKVCVSDKRKPADKAKRDYKNAIYSKWRKVNKDRIKKYKHTWKSKNRQKSRAQNKVYRALKSGELVKGACEVCCTKEGIHGHHDDYTKPLKVRWLCPLHHTATHREKEPTNVT